MIIIGLVGYAGSGKDTAYRLIKNNIENGAERIAFADKLKDVADDMLEIAGFDRVAHDSERKTKEEIRPLLVWLGEYARRTDEYFWINKIVLDVQYLMRAGCPMIVFTDVRYPNEANYILEHNGYLIYIDSPAQPANETEKNTIGKIIEFYAYHSRFFSLWNRRENVAEFLEFLEPIVKKIIKKHDSFKAEDLNNSTETG